MATVMISTDALFGKVCEAFRHSRTIPGLTPQRARANGAADALLSLYASLTAQDETSAYNAVCEALSAPEASQASGCACGKS